MKLLMIINSLDVGGAETSLESLCIALKDSIDIEIITLSGNGYIAQRLKDKNFTVHQLEFNKSLLPFNECIKLYKLISSIKPEVVHTWMYHSNLLGGIISKLLGIKKIIWSVHAFNIQPGMLKPSTRLLIRFLAYFSYFIPHHIICCSKESLKVHEKIFYSKKKMLFIPNGVNTDEYKYSHIFRNQIRSELGIEDKTILVGCIGRFDRQKNQLGFLSIAYKIMHSHKNYHFVIIGRDNDMQNAQLTNLINNLKLNNSITLLGERSDVVKILSALDIFALPSKGEAFPVSLCEAMACEVLCAVTDVGDVDYILGGLIKSVNLNKFNLFYDKLLELGSMPNPESSLIRKKLRSRVKENFSINTIAYSHKDLYERT